MNNGTTAQFIDRGRGLLFSRTGIVIATVGFGLFMRLLGTVVLSRLLDAEAYGIVGIMTSVTIIIAMVSDIGVAAFAIRHEDGDDPAFLDQIWTIRLVRSVVLAAIVILLSLPVAHFMGKPQLAPVIACGCMTFLFDGLSSLANVTSPRNQTIAMLSVMDMLCGLFQFAISLILALEFRSYWALIAAIFLSQALRIVLSYVMFKNSRRRWNWSFDRAKELMVFARYITGSTMLTLLISQSDKLIMGKLFSLDGFGIYMLASSLAASFTPLASQYQQRVAYPKFAAAFRERPHELKTVFYEVRRWQTMGYMFILGGFVGSAFLIIKALYDPRYIGAAPILTLLACAPLFLLNNQAANDVMIAQGRSSFTFWTNLVRVIWLAIAGTAGYFAYGVIGVVAAVGSVEFVAQLYGWIRLRQIGFLDWRYEFQFLGSAAAGFILGSLGSALLAPLIK